MEINIDEDMRKEIRSTLQAGLQNSSATVTFTKADGDERVMRCSLKESDLPARKEVKEGEEVKERKINVDSLAVFDLDKQAWRSFRMDSITSIKYINEKHVEKSNS